ncbi:unnamed protein product [Brassicogethes aeneus]|uniref:Importin-13 n=1 Tax=Brassicogethes aeneus TaxID=1431903 RepID=A0A9P0FHQ7_BRAAE|nr:unnamed protein product [Brassicogethes aeneus]
MEYTSVNLEKAVTLFYRTEAGQQAEAHQWLTEAQNSTQAWSFVWELLSPEKVCPLIIGASQLTVLTTQCSPKFKFGLPFLIFTFIVALKLRRVLKTSSEVQFFAATTLHTKLMKHWSEVPKDYYDFLRKKILDAIISYAMGPKIVLNRLCIALSAFIIHTVPDYWPNAFEELVSSFQPQHLPNIDAERVIWILLEILTVIPEEFQSTNLAITQRNSVRIVLQEVSKDILKVVEMCLMPIPGGGFDISNVTTYLNAARCASAWIQLGGLTIEECGNVIGLLIDLTCFVYWQNSDHEDVSMEEMELTEVTVEALNAIMQHPHTFKYKNHVTKYGASMLYKFQRILDTERNSSDCNKDIVANLYGSIITTADHHSKILIDNLKSDNPENQKISFDFFDSILKCTNLPGYYPVDESCSTYTFAFWYTLQDDILALKTSECAQLLLMIKPYYRNLVCVMLRKAMFPTVEDESWTSDDKEVFRCYRQDIADTLIYCYNVLNIEMLDILHTKLLEALKKDRPNNTEPIRWSEVETCLHAFSAVAESVENECLYLPKLMAIIKDINFNEMPTRVLATALETIGAYSEWFPDHPDTLQHVFPLVIQSIGNPGVATSATMALKDITHNCQHFLLPYADHILMSAQNALSSGLLRLAENKRIMASIGRTLSTLSLDRIMEYLTVILAPSFDEMQRLLTVTPSLSVANSLCSKLRLISALFSSLHIDSQEKIEQPILLVMKNTIPIFKLISDKYYNNGDVMEELCCVIKYAVSSLRDDCKPLIQDILEIIVFVYREYPQPHVIAIAKLIILLLYKEEEFRHSNEQLLHEIVNKTLLMCMELAQANQLSEKSDVFDEFFCMMAALCKKTPQLMFNSNLDTHSLFQSAIICLSMPEIHSLKACGSFLVQYITQSRETAQVEVIQTYGESLVVKLILTLGTTALRTAVDVYCEIFLALNKKYCDNLGRWLGATLAQEGFPTPRINAQQKEHFMKSILREKSSKRKLYDLVLEFMLICKGICKPDAILG